MLSMRQRRQPGSAVVEFSAAMFIFILIFLAILQAGSLMATQVAATNAAREGARAAASRPPGNPQAAAMRAASGFQGSVDVGSDGADSVKVTVTLRSPVVFGYLGKRNWLVKGSATMRKER